jgi:N-formylglutamate amidohydrolase
MKGIEPRPALVDPPYEIVTPEHQLLPLVLASPHSGDIYPKRFLAESQLDTLSLRRSEDSFVDRLFAPSVALGVPLLRARFPRAYVDVNREPYELDPRMFADNLPDYVNVKSSRVASGLGTVPRLGANGREIYVHKLRFAAAAHRIETLYRPYHRALERLVEETRQRFGMCLLIDCHSMPSVGGRVDRDSGQRRKDVVLGDCHGSACAPLLVEQVEHSLRSLSWSVKRNDPYAGGFTTHHYGRPADGVHALQIELNRALYMDEGTIKPTADFAMVAARLTEFIRALADADLSSLAAPHHILQAAE